jgi:Zinc finger, C3HC4 type (RING finger)
MRYDNASLHYALDHAGDGGFLYQFSRSILFWESDDESCRAVGMAALPKTHKQSGSLALLWPLFLSFCASSFVETLVSALQNRQPITENSLFEQSLAFAEAEALVVRPFEIAMIAGKADPDGGFPVKVNHVKRVMNVTQEVLLISLISALSNLSSNVLAVFGKRKKWRLVNTAIWGFAYMGAFLWGIFKVFTEDNYDMWNFHFPTVFVIGFIPHLLIIIGMLGCATIYGFALLLMMLSPPPGQHSPTTIRERFAMAYENLQANVYLATGENIRFSWEDDFYSSLLKAGFTILSCASEAVYLNESTDIRVGGLTWLEQNRMEELAKRHGLLFQKMHKSIPNEIKRKAATGYATVDEADQRLTGRFSGYAIERKPRSRDRNTDPILFNTNNGNIGVVERHGRLSLALRFMRGLFWLSLAITLNSFFTLCRLVGITYRPLWVRRLVGPGSNEKPHNEPATQPSSLDFWVLSDDGNFKPASDPSIDVEAEMRRQQKLGRSRPPVVDSDRDLDERLYDWWKLGGWWGEADSSGEYVPHIAVEDDDATSVISSAITEDSRDHLDWTTESEDDGIQTPTRADPFPQSSFFQNDLVDPHVLANLLDPQTIEHQQEGRMLARRLRTPGILTRASYQRSADRDRAAVLTSSRAFNPDRRVLDAEEEERRLESFVLEQRQRHVAKTSPKYQHASAAGSSTEDWSSGAPGMGSSGPLCVVCQDSPRTVLLWPCGCLALCDECRVIMATRNFTNCVCCRTSTEAFSRLYVP